MAKGIAQTQVRATSPISTLRINHSVSIKKNPQKFFFLIFTIFFFSKGDMVFMSGGNYTDEIYLRNGVLLIGDDVNPTFLSNKKNTLQNFFKLNLI